MDDELQKLVSQLIPGPRPGDLEALRALAASCSIRLPADYLDYMASSNGGEGPVGDGWIALWPVWEIVDHQPTNYEDFLAFAGNGGNVIYGFDAKRGGEIVEGDLIGLGRHEVIPHGRTLTELLRHIAAG